MADYVTFKNIKVLASATGILEIIGTFNPDIREEDFEAPTQEARDAVFQGRDIAQYNAADIWLTPEESRDLRAILERQPRPCDEITKAIEKARARKS